MNTSYKSHFWSISLLLSLAASVTAAPGDLDLNFGSRGIVITRGNNINHLNEPRAMAIQTDGKIIVVGEGSRGSFNWGFAVVRYNPDGSLDSSFGTGDASTSRDACYLKCKADAIGRRLR